jgi:hypothetical protein
MITDSFSGSLENFSNFKKIYNDKLDTILAIPQSAKYNIGGFVINAKLSEDIEQKAEVTTNPLESGEIISDHVVVQPTTITITGEVSNLELLPRTTEQSAINKHINNFTNIITPYIPNRTNSQKNKIQGLINKAESYLDLADEAIKKGRQIYDVLNGEQNYDLETNQKAFRRFFDAMLSARMPMTITTKNWVWMNMVIVGFSENSDNESFLRFALTFQEVRFAETETLKLTPIGSTSSQVKYQVENKVDIGKQNGKDEPNTILLRIFGNGQGLNPDGTIKR